MKRAVTSKTPALGLDTVYCVPNSVCCLPVPSASSKKLTWRNRQMRSFDVLMCCIPMTQFLWGRIEKNVTFCVNRTALLFPRTKTKKKQINWTVRCVWKSMESNAKFNSELELQTRLHQPRLATTCDRSSELYSEFGLNVRKTYKMHTFLNNLFHLIYPRHVSNSNCWSSGGFL